MARKKPVKQLDREIAASLAARGQPGLAAMFADPETRATFAREMRHELTKQRLAREGAVRLAARPYTVKRLELMGSRRVRSLLGRYATETEARARADAVDGWVEHEGRVIYGVEKQSDPGEF